MFIMNKFHEGFFSQVNHHELQQLDSRSHSHCHCAHQSSHLLKIAALGTMQLNFTMTDENVVEVVLQAAVLNLSVLGVPEHAFSEHLFFFHGLIHDN